MNGLYLENIILHGLSLLGLLVAFTLTLTLCIQRQKRSNAFSWIERSRSVSHPGIKILIVVLGLSLAAILLMHSGKWPAATVWSFPGQESDDFERRQLPNLEISTTCEKEEKALAREIFHYKTGISSMANVRAAARRLHDALKDQGYHEYYVGQIVELKMHAFYDQIRPL